MNDNEGKYMLYIYPPHTQTKNIKYNKNNNHRRRRLNLYCFVTNTTTNWAFYNRFYVFLCDIVNIFWLDYNKKIKPFLNQLLHI